MTALYIFIAGLVVSALVYTFHTNPNRTEELSKGESFKISVKYDKLYFDEFFPKSFKGNKRIWSKLHSNQIIHSLNVFGEDILLAKSRNRYFKIKVDTTKALKDNITELVVHDYEVINPLQFRWLAFTYSHDWGWRIAYLALIVLGIFYLISLAT